MKKVILLALLVCGSRSANAVIMPTVSMMEAANKAATEAKAAEETKAAETEKETAKADPVDAGVTGVSGTSGDQVAANEEDTSQEEDSAKDKKDSKKDKKAPLPVYSSNKEAIDETIVSRKGLIEEFSEKLAAKNNKGKETSFALSCYTNQDQYSDNKKFFSDTEKRLNGGKKKSRWGFINPINWAKGTFRVAKAMFSWPFSKVGKKGEAEIGKVKGPRLLGFENGKVILGYDVSLRAEIDSNTSDEKSGRKMDVKSYQLCSATAEDVAVMLGKDIAWVEKKLKIGKFAKSEKKSKEDEEISKNNESDEVDATKGAEPVGADAKDASAAS